MAFSDLWRYYICLPCKNILAIHGVVFGGLRERHHKYCFLSGLYCVCFDFSGSIQVFIPGYSLRRRRVVAYYAGYLVVERWSYVFWFIIGAG